MKKILYLLLLLIALNGCYSHCDTSNSDRFVVIYEQPITGKSANDLYILTDSKTGMNYLVVRCVYGISITRL